MATNTGRTTRSSVLGKRSHQPAASNASASSPTTIEFDIPTPESTPSHKRVKTTNTIEDGDWNKENIPPLRIEALNATPSGRPRTARSVSGSGATSSRAPSTPSRRRVSGSLVTPPATPSHLSIATFSAPPLFLPLPSRVRALLRATCNGSSQVAGRDNERATIQSFIASFVTTNATDDNASTLYISGSPGTGKTAMVNAVLAALTEEELSDSKLVLINCVALNGIDALYARLGEELGHVKVKAGRKGKKLNSKEAVENIFAKADTKCILVLDELDHIASSTQALLSLFTLAENHRSTLRIIGIANTHTLTSSPIKNSKNVETLHFAPYTPVQLSEILDVRLKSLTEQGDEEDAERVKKLLPKPALTLLTKKIAAQTGDVRALFEVLRGAIDIAVSQTAADRTETNPLEVPVPAVTPQHVLAALKAYAPASAPARPSTAVGSAKGSTCNSEIIAKIKDLGLQCRLALLSLMLASKRLESGLTVSGSSTSSSPLKSPLKRTASASTSLSSCVGIDTTQLHGYYATVLTRSSKEVFTPVSRSEFADLLGMLETVGLVSLSSSSSSPTSTPTKAKGGRKPVGRTAPFGGKQALAQEARLVEGVRAEEVLRGLGLSGCSGSKERSIQEEEVASIWERERAKTVREVKTKLGSAAVVGDAFEGASED